MNSRYILWKKHILEFSSKFIFRMFNNLMLVEKKSKCTIKMSHHKIFLCHWKCFWKLYCDLIYDTFLTTFLFNIHLVCSKSAGISWIELVNFCTQTALCPCFTPAAPMVYLWHSLSTSSLCWFGPLSLYCTTWGPTSPWFWGRFLIFSNHPVSSLP